MVGITVIQCGEIREERSLMALQMTWQPNLKRRNNAPPLGLKNLGNSCYLNSVLQCLTYTPPLANFCLKSQHTSHCDSAAEERGRKGECPFCILEKRIVRSLSIDQTLDAPHKINNCLRVFAEHFRLGRQEDAHEFLRYVIDACHNTCLGIKKLQQQQQQQQRHKAILNGGGSDGFRGSSVVKEIFGGALQSQVKCLSCGAESNKVDEIMDISLDVLSCSSLKDALHKFFQSEVLDGNNKYKCDKCKKLVSARKQLSILQAPNVLVIQLKRFEGIFGGKIDKAIAFEDVLVLSSYMCKASQDPRPEYNLFATIVHSGFSPDSGHYYAYIKDSMSRWYCCDDSFVSLSTLQEVLSEKVYILFFSRSKQRPLTANTALGTNGIKSNGCNGNDASKIPKTGPIKAVNSKQFVSQSLDKDKINSSKVDEVPSSPRMKLGSFGNSGTKQFPAPDNVKLIFHRKESCEKNGDVKSSNFMKKSENNSTSLKDTNGITKSSDFAIDGERRHSVFLANGKDKIQNISVDSSVVKCEVDGITNRMSAGRGPNHQVLQNGSINCVADKLGSKQKFKEEDSWTLNAEDARSPNKSEELNSKRKIQDEDSYNSFAEDGQLHHKLQEWSSNEKLQAGNSCISLTEELSCKRKVKGKDKCILFAEDVQSRRKLEELKDTLKKEASLVLRSCGWSNDVHNFMRSKRVCAWVADNDSSNKNNIKSSLIADARTTFLSQVPESLKGNLIERLRSFSQEKRCLGP